LPATVTVTAYGHKVGTLGVKVIVMAEPLTVPLIVPPLGPVGPTAFHVPVSVAPDWEIVTVAGPLPAT
jgi:hypothetical protein